MEIVAPGGGGVSPLGFLLALVAMPEAPMGLRLAAAKEAAPYVHRKLAPLPAPKGQDDPARTVREDDGWGDDLTPMRPN